jgi:hypothetical protein
MYFGGTKANTAAMNTRNRATLSVACMTDVRLQKRFWRRLAFQPTD